MSENQIDRGEIGTPCKVVPEVNEAPKLGHTLTNGAQVMAARRLSDNPGDYYLHVVLCLYRNKWVVWGYNVQDRGAFGGHYFAAEDFAKAVSLYERWGT